MPLKTSQQIIDECQSRIAAMLKQFNYIPGYGKDSLKWAKCNKEELAFHYNSQGLAFINLGNNAKAINCFKQAIKWCDNPIYDRNLGVAFYKIGKLEAALINFSIYRGKATTEESIEDANRLCQAAGGEHSRATQFLTTSMYSSDAGYAVRFDHNQERKFKSSGLVNDEIDLCSLHCLSPSKSHTSPRREEATLLPQTPKKTDSTSTTSTGNWLQRFFQRPSAVFSSENSTNRR